MQKSNEMSLEMRQKSIEKVGLATLLLHIPLFTVMAKYFETEIVVATAFPLALIAFQYIVSRFGRSQVLSNMLFGFTTIAFSGIMIHLGKGMVEWHFHIFVSIGILCVFASYWTLIAAALTAAVHHTLFYLYLPASVFNYEASLGIVAIHAAFVVAQTIACLYVARNLKQSLALQYKLGAEVLPIADFLRVNSRSNKEVADMLNSLSMENAESIRQLAERSKDIHEMLTETSANCSQASTHSSSTAKAIEEGDQILESVGDSAAEISELRRKMHAFRKDTEDKLGKVVDAVAEVLGKTEVINEIVFQTKLLSFNASVEAERAGAQGKGFAVVAQEVGNLAKSSGAAAANISTLAQDSQKFLLKSVEEIRAEFESTEATCESVEERFLFARKSLNSKFLEIKGGMDKLDSLVRAINTAAHEQEEAVKQIHAATGHFRKNSEQVNASTEEINKAATSLNAEAEKFHSLFNDEKQAA